MTNQPMANQHINKLIIVKKNIQLQTIIFLLTLVWASPILAQTTLKVVTETIEKTFDYKKGDEVNIEGEKADVSIESWRKNKVFIKIELISKNADKKVAKSDLKYLKYEVRRIKNKIYIRNFRSEKGAKSSLSVKYTIYLPEECPVYLKNHFGVASISNLSNKLRINSQFSKIDLVNIQGLMEVTTRFGDIIGERLNGRMSINARRSNIMLSDIKGHYDIQAQYGMIKIFSDDELLDLKIDAEKADVFLFSTNPAIFGYALTSKQGNINLPEYFEVKELENTQILKQVEVRPVQQEYYHNITIRVTFGDITVAKKQ